MVVGFCERLWLLIHFRRTRRLLDQAALRNIIRLMDETKIKEQCSWGGILITDYIVANHHITVATPLLTGSETQCLHLTVYIDTH